MARWDPPRLLPLLVLLLVDHLIEDAAAVDGPVPCQTNPCINGGSCYEMQTRLEPGRAAGADSPPPPAGVTAVGTAPQTPAPAVANTRCTGSFQPVGRRCLRLSSASRTAADGRRLCARLGGRLAAVSAEEAPLLVRRLLPLHQYVWTAGGAGWPLQPPQSQLCPALPTDTGRLVGRHCLEPHRSLCERRPLATTGRRRRQSSAAPASHLHWGQSCHCPNGFGNDVCTVAYDIEGAERMICDGARIGNPGSQVIIDFGYFGRMPFDDSGSVPDCYQPDLPLPPDSAGCMAPAGETVIRYWCQGKEHCTPQSSFIDAFQPNSCGLDVRAVLRVRYRNDAESSVTACALAGSFYQRHGTCYRLTDTAGQWEDQLLLCRQWGGDMAHLPHNDGDFLVWLQSRTGGQDVWVAGEAAEPRPVVDLRRQWYMSAELSCLRTNRSLDRCQRGRSLHAVCALPPWLADNVPPSATCPAADFSNRQKALRFPETAVGHTAQQPCGQGYTGNATYTCGLNGVWSTPFPDLTGCRSEDIDVDGAADRLANGTEPVSTIVAELAANCSRATLTSGDVIGTAQLLSLMVQTQHAQLEKADHQVDVAGGYVGNMTQLVSRLTGQGATVSWLGMPARKRTGTSTAIQINMEQSAYLLAGYLNDTSKVFMNHPEIRLKAGRFGNSSLSANLHYQTEQGSSVTLPKEVSRYQDDQKRTSIVFIEYGNMDCLITSGECRSVSSLTDSEVPYPSFVNSPLVSAGVSGQRFIGNSSVVFRNSNVTIQFKTRLSASKINTTNVRCAFWNDTPSNEHWSTEGCFVAEVSDDIVECHCNHLTSFATLMDITGIIHEGSGLDLALQWLTNLGCTLSLICLALCVLVFSVIPSLRNQRTSVHRNLCICLFLAELILLAGLSPHGNAVGCAIVAGLLHFFFLAAFAWMCVEGVQIYLLLYKVFDSGKSYMHYFYAFGYAVPALIVIISVSATKGHGYGTEQACWLSTEDGLIWAFAGPLLAIVLVNMLALVLALRVTVRVTAARSSDRKQASTWIRGSASLVAILGTTWLFGFLYFANGLLFFAVVFTILNSLQGVFIFVFHVVLNEKNFTEATRFFWKTTNSMGLTSKDLSTTTGATSTGTKRQPKTAETTVASTSGDVPAVGGEVTAGQTRPRPIRRLVGAVQRAGRTHYSVKRVDEENLQSMPANQEALKKVDSMGATVTRDV